MGGQADFEAHVRAFGPKITGYLTRVLGDEDDAADAYSLWAEDVWKGLGGLRAPGAAKVWTYRVAWNAAVRVRRQAWNKRRQRMRSSMASRVAADVLSRTPGAVEREAEQLTRLREGLGPAERSMLVLHVDRGLSWSEVAEVMAEEGEVVDEAALRQRYARLRKKLSARAKELGMLPEEDGEPDGKGPGGGKGKGRNGK
jgi:RNA polymerase sigma-70 factor (ECF subfamily)